MIQTPVKTFQTPVTCDGIIHAFDALYVSNTDVTNVIRFVHSLVASHFLSAFSRVNSLEQLAGSSQRVGPLFVFRNTLAVVYFNYLVSYSGVRASGPEVRTLPGSPEGQLGQF